MKQDAASHLRDAAGAHMGFMVKCENGRSSHNPSGKRSVTAFRRKQHRFHSARRRKNTCRASDASIQRKRDNAERKNNYRAL